MFNSFYGLSFNPFDKHQLKETDHFTIQEQITYLYKEKRQPLLLAVDETQYLNTGILNDTLRKPVHEAPRQRITVHYNYSGLSDGEVSKYILHKIQLAGASCTIIDPVALAAAHSFT